MKPNLRAVPDEEVSQAQIYMARIEQGMRQYRSPAGDISNPKGWQRIDTDARNPLSVDSVLSKQYRVVVCSEVGWFRKSLQFVNRVLKSHF